MELRGGKYGVGLRGGGIGMRWSSVICCLIDRITGATELEVLQLQDEQLYFVLAALNALQPLIRDRF